MIKYICKLSNTDLFCKNGYQTVDLWNSTMFKSTFWTKRKQQLLTIPHFFQDEALDLFYISLMVFYVDCKVSRSGYPDRWTREFAIDMPVLKMNAWDANKALLESTLNFLTGDRWHFSFRERPYYIEGEANFKKSLQRYRNTRKFQDTDTFVCYQVDLIPLLVQ